MVAMLLALKPAQPATADIIHAPHLAAAAADPEPTMKLAALSSLTHLVLGGMVKAKGNVAKVAALLVDDEQGEPLVQHCSVLPVITRLMLGQECMTGGLQVEGVMDKGWQLLPMHAHTGVRCQDGLVVLACSVL
jgi:hypothetical protein